MILYLTGLTAVDPEQIEAARIDGARGMHMLWHVIIPQLRPATFIAVVVTIVGALRSFDLVQVMTDGGPFGSSSILALLHVSAIHHEFPHGLWRCYRHCAVSHHVGIYCILLKAHDPYRKKLNVSRTYPRSERTKALCVLCVDRHRRDSLAHALAGGDGDLGPVARRFECWQLLGDAQRMEILELR